MINNMMFFILFIILTLSLSVAYSGVVNVNPVVKVVCFHAADIERPTNNEIQDYANVIVDAQNYYREQMKNHRYGQKTFSVDLKQIGEVNITVVRGTKKLKDYTSIALLENDLPNENRIMFGDNDNIQVIFLAGSFGFDGLFNGFAAVEFRSCWFPADGGPNQCIHRSVIPTGDEKVILHHTTHELGHSFMLAHNALFGFLMNPVPVLHLDNPKLLGSITAAEAAILDKHRYFIEMPIEEKDASLKHLDTLPLLWGSLKML